MTSQERQFVLQLIGQALTDNAGNRITRALAIGICGDIDNNLPQPEQPKPEQPNDIPTV